MKKRPICSLLFVVLNISSVSVAMDNSDVGARKKNLNIQISQFQKELNDLPNTAKITKQCEEKYINGSVSLLSPTSVKDAIAIEIATRRSQRNDKRYELTKQLKVFCLQQELEQEQQNSLKQKEERLKEIHRKLEENQRIQHEVEEEKKRLSKQLTLKTQEIQQASEENQRIQHKAEEEKKRLQELNEEQKNLRKKIMSNWQETVQKLIKEKEYLITEGEKLTEQFCILTKQHQKDAAEKKILEEEKELLLANLENKENR